MERKDKKDLAKHTVLVLLILTIMLSSISTWIVLDALDQVKDGYSASKSAGQISTQGNIRVGILNAQASSETNEAGAEVRLAIIK